MSAPPWLSAARSSLPQHHPQPAGGGGGGSRLAWPRGPAGAATTSSSSSSSSSSQAFAHAVPPSDPLRQAKRLPIKVLKMLTARTGHILHPEYLQPLPSTPVSPIELDAKKSPLALLAQTCSQIGKPDPSPSSKLSSVASSGGDKEAAKSGPLKLSDIGVDDKSSFKPYSKPGADKKESSGPGAAGAPSGTTTGSGAEKAGFRVPSATCQPFTPRTGSPTSSAASACSPGLLLPGDAKSGEGDKKEAGAAASEGCAKEPSGRLGSGGGLSDLSQAHEGAKGLLAGASAGSSSSEVPGGGIAVSSSSSSSSSGCSSSSSSSTSSVLSSGLVAPVSPYKAGQSVFPLPPAGMSYPGALAGAYAGYPPQFLPHGVALDPSKPGSLVGSLACGKTAVSGSSPLAGASPPSVMTASLCRDPYCLSYHCASQLAGAAAASASCAHEQALKAAGYPTLVYPTAPPPPPPPPLHAVHSSPAALYGPYGFLLPNEPQPHACNWVSASGPCDKRFSSSDELLSHLRTHTAFPGTDKLLAAYPGSGSSLAAAAAAAAAMACHMHAPAGAAPASSPGSLALRSPHHALGLGGRYHPYSKSPLPTPGAPVPVSAASGPYYSPYALYGQRLTTASALGYQ